MAEVFISYARKDAEFVRQLYAALSKSEKQPWVDWMDIEPSINWWDEIREGIENADVFLL